jgi:presenilin-like A22 family membrane protease
MNKKIRFLIKNMHFSFFSSNHYNFCEYFFLIAIAFYSMKYVANKKKFKKKKINELEKIILMEKIYFSFVILCVIFTTKVYFHHHIIKENINFKR